MAQAIQPTTSTTSSSNTSEDPSGAHTQNIQEWIKTAKEAIWSRRPILGEIMQKHGDDTLFDYSKDFLDVNPSPYLDARKPELISVVEELLEARLGKKVAAEVAKQLLALPLVSTTDHHSPINHPFWVNANIISAIPYVASTLPDLKYLVVFSFASVSVNNASGYPRGIEFHGGINGSGNFVRLPLLPDKLKMGVVYGTRGFNREDIDRALASLRRKQQEGDITPERAENIIQIIEKYYAAPEVLKAPDLSSQITEINYSLWPRLFHDSPRSHLAESKKIPDLIYLEIETIVREMLLRFHLGNPDSLIYKVLFDKEWLNLAMKSFNGIPGAFNTEKDTGTHFFWAVDDKQHRVRLQYKGDTLSSPGGEIVVKYTPEGISEALKDGTIFPSMLTCYLLVSLYYGMKCLGGFCQVHDLTMTKQAWRKMLETQGLQQEAEALIPVQTKELGGDGMVLAYFESIQGGLVPATGLDMVLEAADTRYEAYVELSRKLTLNDAMQSLLPEMYTVLFSVEERKPELTAVKPETILKETGLTERLRAHIKEHH